MGFIGPIQMEAVRRLNFVDIAIAASTDISAKEAAEKYGIQKYYGNWEHMVRDPEIEVVHICTPNDLHYPIAKLALSLGKHVVCDKPLTLAQNQTAELVELAEKAQVVNAVTFNSSFYPMIQQARLMVEDGQIGKINYLQGHYLQDWMLYDSDYNWRVEAKYQGASRVVGDIGVHCLYMLQTITGQKIVEVYSDFNRFIEKRKKPLKKVATYGDRKDTDWEEIKVDTEDQATLLLKFENGTRGLFVGGQCFAGRKNRLGWEIYGSEKSLSWNGEEPNQLWVGNRLMGNEVLMKDFNLVDKRIASLCDFAGGLQEGYAESWKNLMKIVYAAILEGKHNETYPSFKDALQIQKVVDATVESNKLKQWVKIR